MTRETKIGLLVGLAFIIVVGILIADYSSQGMKPPQAPIVNAARNVYESYNVPGVRRRDPAQVDLGPVQHDRPIAFGDENSRDRSPLIRFGGPDDGRDRSTTRELVIRDEQPIDGGREPIHTETPGRDLIPDGRGHDRSTEPVVPMEGLREHKAEAGDTVSRLAARYLGSNTKTNRDLIIKANPALVANPDRIVVGQTYRIPAQRPAPAPESPATPTPRPTEPTPPAAGNTAERTVSYVTRPGDSLWKIAVDQCGSGSGATVGRIKELNKDVLRGGDNLRPNVTLRLPARSR